MNHYDIPGVSNDWFKSYLSNRNRYVSVNGYDSCLVAINYDDPQDLQTILFLLYKDGLSQAITFCKAHQIADNTNLLYLSNSFKNQTN